ncbi:MAG TPA: diguanylate cyclase [Candidatus Aquabacterium excrementipullorum]|nr:diguanylate cyclase [Candidatus Aquabacterium excrementipullorum]
MGALIPMDMVLLLLTGVLCVLWGVTLRATWQHIYQGIQRGEAASWGWVIASALVLGFGLWSAMLVTLGALQLDNVPIVLPPSALIKSLLMVTSMHLLVFGMAPYMPRETKRRQLVAMLLAMVSTGGAVLSMLYMTGLLHLAPTGNLAWSGRFGLAMLTLSGSAMSYRQIENRWRGGITSGVFYAVVLVLCLQLTSWPRPVYYIGSRDALTLTWLALPLAAAGWVAMSTLLGVAWIQRLKLRLGARPLPVVTPDAAEVENLAETTARDMVEDRKRRDALYDRVLRHSAVRFWGFDVPGRQFQFRGELSLNEPLSDTDLVIDTDEWFGAHLHPEEAEQVHKDVMTQLAAKGGFDLMHRLRARAGEDSWRWVIARAAVVRRDALGKPTYIVGTHIDVTEHGELQAALDRDSRLFSDGPIVMIRWRFDTEAIQATDLDFISPNIEKLWGYTLEEMHSFSNWEGLIDAGDLAGIGKKVHDALNSGISEITHEFRVKLKDGRLLWHSLFAHIEADDDGALISGFIVDIDAFKRVEQRSQEQGRQLEELIEELQRAKEETIILRESSEFLNSAETLDEAFNIISRAAYAIFPAWSGALASAQDNDRLKLVGRWGEAQEFNTEFSSGDCWALRRGRAHHFVDERISLRCRHVHAAMGEQPRPYLCIPMSANGESVGSLHLMAAKTLNKDQMLPLAQRANRLGETLKLALSNLRLRAGLREQATHDSLTGLYNRRFMNDRLPVEIKRCERESERLALAMIDVDHFKHFNDQHGHDAGDTVLRALGELLRQRVRVYDLACRYGGEELALIMPGCSIEDAQTKLESIRAEVEAMTLMFNGIPLPPVTISVGLADTLGGDAEALLKVADERLYHAKRTGRNRLVAKVEYRADDAGNAPAGASTAVPEPGP